MVDKHVPEDGGTVKSRSAAMMVAKATAQRQEICSALVDATTHLLVMLSPLLDSDRARLATDPFGPRPKHPDCALEREEAPARARDLPADIARGEMGWGWWSSEARQRRLLATRSAATCRNYGAVPAVHHTQTREPRHQVKHGAQTEAVGWHRGRRWFARVELAKPSKICGGCGSAARPPLGPKLGSF